MKCQRVLTAAAAATDVVSRGFGTVMNISTMVDLQQRSVYDLFSENM